LNSDRVLLSALSSANRADGVWFYIACAVTASIQFFNILGVGVWSVLRLSFDEALFWYFCYTMARSAGQTLRRIGRKIRDIAKKFIKFVLRWFTSKCSVFVV
jgi:hypothetical protein